jgi:hypothetical protein
MAKQDRFDAARRAVPLPELWERYGRKLTLRGERFESPYTPCCGDSQRKDAGSLYMHADGAWRYHCFRCTKGGSAVDLVAAEERITPTEAVKKLLKDGGGFEAVTGRREAPPKPRMSDSERRRAIARVAKAILSSKSLHPNVRKYLEDARGISPAVVDEAVARGLLRGLPPNADAANAWLGLIAEEDDLKASRILKPGSRRMAAAYRPLVFLTPRGEGIEFATITPPAQRVGDMPKSLQYGFKDLPLVWQQRGDVRKILVIEGGIDLLSVVSLGFSQDTLILGLLGSGTWQRSWVEATVKKYPHALWQLGMDVDDAGSSSSETLAGVLEELGARSEALTPWGGGKDWNDTLLAARSF